MSFPARERAEQPWSRKLQEFVYPMSDPISRTALPWRYDAKHKSVVDRNGRALLRIAAPTWPSDLATILDEAHAIGHLCAAAPDLQAAVRELLALIERDSGADLEPELTGLKAALRKAEGR